ncbi:MAG: type II toxin-antitoxin system RelE/ParE family toxin [Clostridia bacterium]|nr:type II toxin-antitoxin system RelE/ParE family toxin [Clostridia bacterium]
MKFRNKYRLIASEQVYLELSNIYMNLCFSLGSINLADCFYKKVKRKIMSLRVFPERFVSLFKFQNSNSKYRKMNIGNCVIIFEIDKAGLIVYIHHIFHE